jgi:hypothetical protein
MEGEVQVLMVNVVEHRTAAGVDGEAPPVLRIHGPRLPIPGRVVMAPAANGTHE